MSLDFQQIVGKLLIKPQYSHVEVGHTVSYNRVAGTWKRAMNEREPGWSVKTPSMSNLEQVLISMFWGGL